MLTNITWFQYFGFLIAVLSVYYIVIGIKFYPYELKSLLTLTKSSTFYKSTEQKLHDSNDCKPGLALFDTNKKDNFSDEKFDHSFHQIELLTVKLKDAIADASFKNYNKEEFTFLLQLTLKEYPNLKGLPFQVAINNLIISECEKYGSLHLSAEELVMLWNEVA